MHVVREQVRVLANKSGHIDDDIIEEEQDEEADTFLLATKIDAIESDAPGHSAKDALHELGRPAKRIKQVLSHASEEVIVPSTRDDYRR